MNTLVEGYDFQSNSHSKSGLPEENHAFKYEFNHVLDQFSIPSGSSSSFPVDESSPEGDNSKEFSVPTNWFSPAYDSCSSEGEISKENDHSDAILKFISQMLMEEEDLENKPCMLHDCLALQATEKSLYDVLNNNQNVQSPNDHFTKTFSSSSSDFGSFLESNSSPSGDFESLVSPSDIQYPSTNNLESDLVPFGSSMERIQVSNSYYQSNSREKKNRFRKDRDFIGEQRSSKQFANNISESEPLEMYDKVLLCSDSEQSKAKKKPPQKERQKGSNRGRPRGGKKQGVVVKEVVDLRSLLMQCAQAVASYDCRTSYDLLTRIRQHASPRGDGTERLAHYFANALEARLAGNGTASYATGTSTRISAAEILKAYKTFITACPFKKMSNMLANKTIKNLANGATTLHIIDFGILYGYQWPCLIQILSERPEGPPKLKITGIDFPQPGFRPTERVEDTGRRLARYCERFRVPFEYIAIAQKWETIKLEDLKIEEHEILVVNSIFRLQNVPDETVMVNSPRDAVLNLIKKINPDMFIHGVVNGTYNTPFFITRFREALFHFSSMFDVFDAVVPREDQDRALFEEEVFGKEVMNIIACEGTERIERPETYKQWQVRNLRAGLRPLPLDQEIVKHVRRKVKLEYHKDFSMDEDGNWLLQGWKGRVTHAISYWQSASK
ncbi:hypothetical protein CDL12_01947 [Handroanthus impetiginosus]|uniref:Uncharacterized protein n=1 Tax=Handroanthus impetiginosus TaxID=429701 RepID=A0A2G9I6F4_9LAMI|nr:hypothetical protein CDL12_01947 [Handroanthus impetiginosus]